MLVDIITKIRKRENRFYDRLYTIARAVRRMNVPATPYVYRPLLFLVKSVMRCSRYCLQKFLWEPMFKVCCEECGNGLRILEGMPLLTENLVMRFGEKVSLNGRNTFSATSVLEEPVLTVGNNTAIGYLTSISVAESVTIGSNCLIAERILICDNNGHPAAPNRRHEKVSVNEIEPIIIGDNVWIGNGAFIGKGVFIGDGAVVGANAVVTREVPENSVVAGIPAMVVRTFSPEEIEGRVQRPDVGRDSSKNNLN